MAYGISHNIWYSVLWINKTDITYYWNIYHRYLIMYITYPCTYGCCHPSPWLFPSPVTTIAVGIIYRCWWVRQATARHLRMFHNWVKDYDHLELLRRQVRAEQGELTPFWPMVGVGLSSSWVQVGSASDVGSWLVPRCWLCESSQSFRRILLGWRPGWTWYILCVTTSVAIQRISPGIWKSWGRHQWRCKPPRCSYRLVRMG